MTNICNIEPNEDLKIFENGLNQLLHLALWDAVTWKKDKQPCLFM